VVYSQARSSLLPIPVAYDYSLTADHVRMRNAHSSVLVGKSRVRDPIVKMATLASAVFYKEIRA
jgi:hypothetical protein